MSINRGRTPKENEVQTAIVTSLQAYCRDNDIRCSALEYYPNQQGGDLRKVCADFIATLDDSTLLLAETKAYANGELLSFDDDQLTEYLRFERAGFPIAYVYNTVDILAYYKKPQPYDYPMLTLGEVNRSVPTQLPNRHPDFKNHSTLLDWLETIPAGGDKSTRFAQIFAAIRAEAILSNGLMMLIYGTKSVKIFENLDPKKLNLLLNSLKRGASGSYLNAAQQKRIEHFLQEEASAFKSWFQSASPNAPQTGPMLPDDDDDRPTRGDTGPRI